VNDHERIATGKPVKLCYSDLREEEVGLT